MNNFIPQLHYDNPTSKLTPAWCEKAKSQYYYNADNKPLLFGKNIEEIRAYAAGNIPMAEFKKMYKSTLKKQQQALQNGTEDINVDALQYVPLPLIPTPVNSAISLLQKRAIEFKVTAQDPLAETKKKEDITFLKNKGKVEADLKAVTAQMNIPDIDLGATEHSAIPFNDSPYGMDLSDPDDADVFINVLYKLGLESCFETLLQAWYDLKNVHIVRGLETRDQFYYGVSVNGSYQSSTTGLPEAEYVFPNEIHVPYSDLPDYSDRTHEFRERLVTPIQLMNYFGDEISNLEQVINGNGTGYCACNKVGKNGYVNYETDPNFKVTLVEMEVMSIDWVGQVTNTKSKKSFTYFVTHDEFEKISEKDTTIQKSKNYGQNTYVFYWLKNTKYYFGIDKLGYATRKKGQEAFQGYRYNIYKSQERSAVENAIGENKKAQIADIKMRHEIMNSAPSGFYIDVKYLRNTIENTTDDSETRVLDDLIALAVERRIMIGDSTGFEGKADGQQKPFSEVKGGLDQQTIAGYLSVIYSAQANIASFTGINQELTGQSRDPDTLIGIEKMRQESSLNAFYYAKEAIGHQYQNMANQWAYLFQTAIASGGKQKEAIEAIIGSRKVDIIKRLSEIPLHAIGVKIEIGGREEEVMRYEQKIAQLKLQNVINSADEYILSYIPNIKDRFALLAVREKNYLKRQDKIRQEAMANQQQIVTQQGENMKAVQTEANQGKIQQIYSKSDAESKLLPLQEQLKAQALQLEGLIKRGLQQDRHIQQTEKKKAEIQEKANVEQQKPFV